MLDQLDRDRLVQRCQRGQRAQRVEDDVVDDHRLGEAGPAVHDPVPDDVGRTRARHDLVERGRQRSPVVAAFDVTLEARLLLDVATDLRAADLESGHLDRRRPAVDAQHARRTRSAGRRAPASRRRLAALEPA